MDLLYRIFGLTTKHQDQVDELVAIVEENEELKKANAKLEEEITNLESVVLMLSEELDAAKQKIKNIEQLFEDSIAAMKDMK